MTRYGCIATSSGSSPVGQTCSYSFIHSLFHFSQFNQQITCEAFIWSTIAYSRRWNTVEMQVPKSGRKVKHRWRRIWNHNVRSQFPSQTSHPGIVQCSNWHERSAPSNTEMKFDVVKLEALQTFSLKHRWSWDPWELREHANKVLLYDSVDENRHQWTCQCLLLYETVETECCIYSTVVTVPKYNMYCTEHYVL